LWAGTAAQAAAVTMTNEVGGDRVGQRRELAGSDRVALDRVIQETPWQPPLSPEIFKLYQTEKCHYMLARNFAEC